MGNSLVKNYAYNLMYEIIALIVPLLTTPYVSRVLGVTGIGNYGYTAGIVSYFGIIAATGTLNYAKREIAFRQNAPESRSILFWDIVSFRIISIFLVSIIYMIFIFSTESSLHTLYKIQLLTFLSWIVDVSWFFQGMEEFKITAIRNAFVKLIGTILIFVLVKTKNDLVIYVFINCIVTLIGNITMLFYLNKYLVIVRLSELHPLSHVKDIMSLFAPVVAIQVYTVLDQTMLGSIVNTTEVGYYTQAQKIIKLALTIISSFAAVLLPRIAVLLADYKQKQIDNYFQKTIDYLFALSLPMMTGCIIIADHFVPIFFGNGFEKVTPIMRILSVLFIVIGFGQIAGSLLVPLQKQRQYTFAVSIGAIVNFSINLLLIPKYAAIGAALASVIAEIVVSAIELYFIKDNFDIRYLYKSFFSYLVPTIIMGGVIWGIKMFFKPTILTMILEVLIGIISYGTILIFRKDRFIVYIFSKLKLY